MISENDLNPVEQVQDTGSKSKSKQKPKETVESVSKVSITNLLPHTLYLGVGGITGLKAGESVELIRDSKIEKILKHFSNLKMISIKIV